MLLQFQQPRVRLLLLLTVVFAFNRMDYTVISIVLPSIKQEFELSDSALGLLTGLGFTFFYALMGVPLSRWADYGNRTSLVSISTILFSIMAIASGMAMNFYQLLAARVGVAIGEAGTMPAAQSLIGEHFERTERARANAFFFIGASLGLGAGFFFGGFLNGIVGWRWALILIGAPGLIVGGLFHLYCKESGPSSASCETRRTGNLRDDLRITFSVHSMSQTVSTAVGHLWRIRSYRCYLVGLGLAAVGSGAIIIWAPSFFIRTHEIDATAIGFWMAGIFVGAGCTGVLIGGELANRFASANEKLQFRAVSALYVAYFLFTCCVFLAPHPQIALLCLFLSVVAQSIGTAPLSAILQTAVPAQMRALAAAMVLLLVNLVMGMGPLFAGIISDGLNALFDENSLRYAILVITPTFILVSWFFWRAGDTVMFDIHAAERGRIPVYSPHKKDESSAANLSP